MARIRECEYYIVDGYNVINAWPELIRLRGNLDEARDVLVRILAEYGAFENYEMTIVFDALFTEDEERVIELGRRLRVIYTGAGAYRIPSPELRRAVKKAKKLMKAEYIGTHTQPAGRIEVHERLDTDTVARLEELRRKK